MILRLTNFIFLLSISFKIALAPFLDILILFHDIILGLMGIHIVSDERFSSFHVGCFDYLCFAILHIQIRIHGPHTSRCYYRQESNLSHYVDDFHFFSSLRFRRIAFTFVTLAFYRRKRLFLIFFISPAAYDSIFDTIISMNGQPTIIRWLEEGCLAIDT